MTDARIHQEQAEIGIGGQASNLRILQSQIEIADEYAFSPEVYYFDGDDDQITLALGAMGFAFGPGTIIAIIRPQETGWTQRIFKSGSSFSSARWELQITSTNRIAFQFGSTTQNSTADVPMNEWSCIAVRKAAGSVPPRYSIFRFESDPVWEHVDGGAIGTGDIPVGQTQIGNGGAFGEYKGDIGIIGATNVVLSDSQIQSLVTERAAWDSIGLLGLWELDHLHRLPLQDQIGTTDQTSVVGTILVPGEIPWTGVLVEDKQIKIGGVFVAKPTYIKQGGVFVSKPELVKVGGTFV